MRSKHTGFFWDSPFGVYHRLATRLKNDREPPLKQKARLLAGAKERQVYDTSVAATSESTCPKADLVSSALTGWRPEDTSEA